jgi:hypothetical protein
VCESKEVAKDAESTLGEGLRRKVGEGLASDPKRGRGETGMLGGARTTPLLKHEPELLQSATCTSILW